MGYQRKMMPTTKDEAKGGIPTLAGGDGGVSMTYIYELSDIHPTAVRFY